MSSSRKPKVIKISEVVREPSKEEEAVKSVTEAEMAKVIEYCKHYFKAAAVSEASGNLDKFEAKLFKDHDRDIGSGLKYAAERLEMDVYRLDLTCIALAEMFKSKSAEEVVEIFSVKDELTPEEEEDLCEVLKSALE